MYRQIAFAAFALLAVLPFHAEAQVFVSYDGSRGEQPDVSVEIAEQLNAYRASINLPPIPVSSALTLVAQAHADDLAANNPNSGVDARGLACNSHSWSDQGDWSPVCYTSDHQYAEGMWRKPVEIVGDAYPAHGFEIAFSSSGLFDAETALNSWRGSGGHDAVIAERGAWSGSNWQAMGVGVANGYAVVWFGKIQDR